LGKKKKHSKAYIITIIKIEIITPEKAATTTCCATCTNILFCPAKLET